MNPFNISRRFGRHGEYSINLLHFDKIWYDHNKKSISFYKSGNKNYSFTFDHNEDGVKEYEQIITTLNDHYRNDFKK